MEVGKSADLSDNKRADEELAAGAERTARFQIAQRKRELERLLRFGGWTRTEAKAETARLMRERRG